MQYNKGMKNFFFILIFLSSCSANKNTSIIPDPNTSFCEEAACTDPTPYCDTSLNSCVECINDSHCEGD